MSAFASCLPVTLHEEGGFVNDPRDPGGMTNLGVTQRNWSKWIGHTASEAEMRALTVVQVTPFYKQEYWDTISGDGLPAALACVVFDHGVNDGPSHAVSMLQALVSARQDGNCGPKTLGAVSIFVTAHSLGELVRQFCAAREADYRSKENFHLYGNDWLARVQRVETAALRMIP